MSEMNDKNKINEVNQTDETQVNNESGGVSQNTETNEANQGSDEIKGMMKYTDKKSSFFSSKSFKYGTNSFILIAIVVAIAVFINLLASYSPLKVDLTPNKMFSIGDTTKTILKDLKKDVEIIGLFDDTKVSDTPSLKQVKEVLNQYTKYPHVKVSFLDPDKNPGYIKELDPDNLKGISKGDFIVKSGTKIKQVTGTDIFNQQTDANGQATGDAYFTGEQSFTGAIKYVTADKTPTVYFLEGHDENNADTDYKTVKMYLDRNNYDVKTLNLLTTEKVPADAEIVMVASPKRDLSTNESDKLKDFLKNGGKAVFLFDSLETNMNFAQFENVLSDYNISLNYDKVKENDPQRFVPPDQNYDILPDVQSNEINMKLNPSTFAMIMPQSRSINILKNSKEYITVTSLMKSSDKAVGEQIEKSRGANIPGPLDLAVASENKGSSNISKVLVMGNASFMGDTALSQYQQYSMNGMSFFLNSLLWLQDQKNDVVIAPKAVATQALKMTQLQSNFVLIIVLVFIPIIILVLGILIWVRRRHL